MKEAVGSGALWHLSHLCKLERGLCSYFDPHVSDYFWLKKAFEVGVENSCLHKRHRSVIVTDV